MAKQQWEIEAKDRLLGHFQQVRGEQWAILAEDVVVDAATGRNFDYQLARGDRRVALEIFRLIDDGEELARDRVWGEIVQLLKVELTQRGLMGYLIHTPPFKVAKVQREQVTKEIADKLEAAVNANPGTGEFGVDDFRLTKIEGLGTVGFSSLGKGGFVNPPGIAVAALEQKLPGKNEQLNITGHERVVHIVNWTAVVSTEDMIEACAQLDFNRFPNIDRVYFEAAPGVFELVFDRDLFVAFEALHGPPSTHLEPLYIRWLDYRLAQKQRNAFDVVRNLAKERGHLLWLSPFTRVKVVQYGEELIKAAEWENVLWIVRHFRDDPDPGLASAPDDPDGGFNLHLQIQKGEDVRTIATVRGQLCWFLQRIVGEHQTELYPEVFGIVEKYASGENLYVRQQSTVPLIELARRRLARQPNEDRFMSPELTTQVRDLAFRMLRENGAYPRVLEWVAHVFVWIRDLDEEQAKEVIETLLRSAPLEAANDISQLMIYFALFRKTHFPELGAFDSRQFSQMLRDHISRGTERIRASTIWLMWKLLEENQVDFTELAPYIASLPDGPYNRPAFGHFYRITGKHVARYPDLLACAYKKALQREKEFFEGNPSEAIWHFDDAWESLRWLFESGRIDCFLDCIEMLLDYRSRISMFPQPLLEELLTKVADRARAFQLLERLRTGA